MLADLRALLGDVYIWARAISKYWPPLVTGGLITALLTAWALYNGKAPNAAISAWFIIALLFSSFLAWREQLRSMRRVGWSTITPTVPTVSPINVPIEVRRDQPLYTFDLGIGGVQQINFEIPLNIELRGILCAGTASDERYAADVDIDAGGQVINVRDTNDLGHVEKLSHKHFHITKRDSPFNDGFTAFLVQHFDAKRGYRAFSIAVERISAERGIASFSVLATAWTPD